MLSILNGQGRRSKDIQKMAVSNSDKACERDRKWRKKKIQRID